MSNPFAFQPDRLQLVKPPYLTGNLLVTVPVGEQYINSFFTMNAQEVVSAWERDRVNLIKGSEYIEAVIEGLLELQSKNPPSRENKFFTVCDYKPGFSLIEAVPDQRLFDKYETTPAPAYSEMGFDLMCETVKLGYQRLVAQQER